VRGLGGHEARVEAGALGDGRARQPLGERMVVAGPGSDRDRARSRSTLTPVPTTSP